MSKNNDGSIDVMDRYGFTEYTVGKNEIGIVAKLANKLYEYENFFTERLKDVLMNYFDVPSDTYAYNLTRHKTAFFWGNHDSWWFWRIWWYCKVYKGQYLANEWNILTEEVIL